MSEFRFIQLYPDAPLPNRAERGLFGTSPLRGFQYCEPFCAANELGWHAFPPMDFVLKWDGSNVFWFVPEGDSWVPLKSLVLPGFSEVWTECYPLSADDGPPPFLSALPEPGLVQIWPGVLARSPEGWALLVRPPANLPRSLGYEILEGVIETDWWFGPLITTIRLCRTEEPILFRRRLPIVAFHPVPRAVLKSDFYSSVRVQAGLDALTPADWADYKQATALHGNNGRLGGYKTAVRSRSRGGRPP